MRTNRSSVAVAEKTYEGGRAARRSAPEAELERTVLSCLLWETNFYETGDETAARIAELCSRVPNDRIYALAEKARSEYNLRHVPLWLLVQAARKNGQRAGLAGAMGRTIQRPDEMGEFLSLYWRDGRCPIAKQVQRGLSRAFGRFSRHQLAKWDRDSDIKLRDVMFLSHPKPRDAEQAALFGDVAGKKLGRAGTWEEELSAGKDKKATWESFLAEHRLGVMALLMNLRNMEQAGADRSLVRSALARVDKSRAFPYRFLTAARHAPWLSDELSQAMLERIRLLPRLSGETHVLVDVSGSMDASLSSRSEASRLDAASSVAVVAREQCEAARVFTFSDGLVEVPNSRGIPLVYDIHRSQRHNGTYLVGALARMATDCGRPDRIIVITDEQTHDGNAPCQARKNGYIVNVAPYKPALEARQKGWTRINGWSDRLVEWIAAHEADAGWSDDSESGDAY